MNPTTDKITKLKEIDELLKSGTISKDEFDKLKEEILNTQYQKPVEQKLVDEKVIIVPKEVRWCCFRFVVVGYWRYVG